MVTFKNLTRRQMLQGMGLAATGAVLAACAPPVAPDASGDGGAMETPEVWFAFSNPCPGGGDPERTNAVRDLIFEETGSSSILTSCRREALQRRNSISCLPPAHNP